MKPVSFILATLLLGLVCEFYYFTIWSLYILVAIFMHAVPSRRRRSEFLLLVAPLLRAYVYKYTYIIIIGASSDEKVLLMDVTSFLAELGRMTTSRKSERVPQVNNTKPHN